MKENTILSSLILLIFFILIISITSCNLVHKNTIVNLKPNPHLLTTKWDAKWICHPKEIKSEPSIFLFRKDIRLNKTHENFIINISADNRYKLFVNEKFVSFGPSKSRIEAWNYETLDISNYLEKGINTISIIIWNYGKYMPISQTSIRTGLIIQGNSKKERIINTNQSWKVLQDCSQSFFHIPKLYAYLAPPGEKIDCTTHPWGWKSKNFSIANWKFSKELEFGLPKKLSSLNFQHFLTPRTIPLMEFKKQEIKCIRDIQGLDKNNYSNKKLKNITIPKNCKVKIIVDQGILTTAFPYIRFSGGKNSLVKITYSESYFITNNNEYKNTKDFEKGNRNIIKGKEIIGSYDIILPDGGINRVFEPNWWRVFRYIEIEIITKNNPLIIKEFYSNFTAYPLDLKAKFKSDDSNLQKIWSTACHTQKLCMSETFFDCPYYEQIQYIGDTRIQGLTSFYMSGDTVLWKKAIDDFANTQSHSGLFNSGSPVNSQQIIPTYSLCWIELLHDYNRHCDDSLFVKSLIPRIVKNISWFENRLDNNGLLTKLPRWNFIDWVDSKSWDHGMPPSDLGGHSAILNLFFSYMLNKAASLMNEYGYENDAYKYKQISESINEKIYKSCWDSKKGLLGDNSEKKSFSQHTQVLAILLNIFPKNKQQEIFIQTLYDKSIAQCNYYFMFYIFEALKKEDMGDFYLELLGPWYNMLDMGLTTFAEKLEPTRSDCHGWSSSPAYHLLSLVCGIEPLSRGFTSVKIAPNLGHLNKINVNFPHKWGMISIKLKKEGLFLKGKILLPKGLSGYFYWKGVHISLHSKKNIISIKAE